MRAVAARVDWVRLLYLYPSDLSDGLIDAILEGGVPYFDLSLQHASRSLLRRMKRWGDGDRFLAAVLALLATAATRTAYVSPRCINLALQHCTHAVGVAAAWRALKPHVPTLVASVCLPTACFDDADAELWDALGHVALKDVVAALPEGLSARVAENGARRGGAQRVP